MEQVPNSPKHIKSFWAIVAIIVVSLILGGLIFWFQFNYTYDEEVNSLEFRVQRRSQEQKARPEQTIKTPPQE